MLIIWTIIFIVALFVLVKGADWLILSSERIGIAVGLSPFIVGAIIVGVGTSFPELVSSIFAVWRGALDVPVANAVGSNIANILLIIGISAVVGKKLTVSKELIDLDLPLLALSTTLFLGIAWDKQIVFGESVLLLIAFVVYLLYSIKHEDKKIEPLIDKELLIAKPKLALKDFVLLAIGIIFLTVGAKYLIDALVVISEILNIATGLIAITAVAVGTSLPELLVSVKAALQEQSDVALGNIFGSNTFNILMVIGIPGLFRTLTIDAQTFVIGLPVLALATVLFIFSGISRKVHIWEGIFFLLLYILFIVKLFAWF